MWWTDNYLYPWPQAWVDRFECHWTRIEFLTLDLSNFINLDPGHSTVFTDTLLWTVWLTNLILVKVQNQLLKVILDSLLNHAYFFIILAESILIAMNILLVYQRSAKGSSTQKQTCLTWTMSYIIYIKNCSVPQKHWGFLW